MLQNRFLYVVQERELSVLISVYNEEQHQLHRRLYLNIVVCNKTVNLMDCQSRKEQVEDVSRLL